MESSRKYGFLFVLLTIIGGYYMLPGFASVTQKMGSLILGIALLVGIVYFYTKWIAVRSIVSAKNNEIARLEKNGIALQNKLSECKSITYDGKVKNKGGEMMLYNSISEIKELCNEPKNVFNLISIEANPDSLKITDDYLKKKGISLNRRERVKLYGNTE